VCLWCVSQAALRKNASPHALKHAQYTDGLLMELSCSGKLHSMEAVSEYSAYLAPRKANLHFTPVAVYPLLATAVPFLFFCWLNPCGAMVKKQNHSQSFCEPADSAAMPIFY